MLRYKTETRPGLVALYDIQPGNGVGQFLQPRSPHGVDKEVDEMLKMGIIEHSDAHEAAAKVPPLSIIIILL